jgi:hypothetical protein
MTPFVKLARKPTKEGVKIVRKMERLEFGFGSLDEASVSEVPLTGGESSEQRDCWKEGVRIMGLADGCNSIWSVNVMVAIVVT